MRRGALREEGHDGNQCRERTGWVLTGARKCRVRYKGEAQFWRVFWISLLCFFVFCTWLSCFALLAIVVLSFADTSDYSGTIQSTQEVSPASFDVAVAEPAFQDIMSIASLLSSDSTGVVVFVK